MGILIIGLTIYALTPKSTKDTTEQTNKDATEQDATTTTPSPTEEKNSPATPRITDEGTSIDIEIDPAFSTDLGGSLDPNAEIPGVRIHKIKVYGIPHLSYELSKSMDDVGSIPNDIATAILRYGSDDLGAKYKTLSIDINSITVNQSMIQGRIQLGDTDNTVPFTATIFISSEDRYRKALVKIGSNESFVYVGGLNRVDRDNFHIRQINTSSTDLSIDGTDKESALSYIFSLGYKVPDFNITFVNYRNPFE